jgi:ribosomal-protein-alanine N-acetyltransferase
MFAKRRKILGRGDRVHIFTPTPASAADFVAFARANEDFHRPWVHPATDTAGYRAYLDRLEAGGAYGFLIGRNADDALIGVINVNDVIMGGFCSASLGYYGSAAFARRGYMAEGLGLVLDQAFGPLGLHRIEANVQPGNAASRALVERLGFRKEGFSPAFLRVEGVWRDHERWAMLGDEWGARAAAHTVSRVV